MAALRTLNVYTDGTCKGTAGTGGWSVVIAEGTKQRRITGTDIDTNKNSMELQAVVEALLFCDRVFRPGTTINIHVDSTYVRSGVTNWIEGWKRNNWLTSKKEEVKNKTLWKQLDALTRQHIIVWDWVKSGSGNSFVDLADQLATEAVIAL